MSCVVSCVMSEGDVASLRARGGGVAIVAAAGTRPATTTTHQQQQQRRRHQHGSAPSLLHRSTGTYRMGSLSAERTVVVAVEAICR